MTPRTPSQTRLEAVIACAEAGLTRQEAAKRLSVSYMTIGNYARRYNIPFKHAKARGADDRSLAMQALYRDGYTLEEIGAQFSVTRERVRQIIKKEFGLTGNDGGSHTKAVRNAQRRAARRDGRCYSQYGCSFEQWKELLAAGATYPFIQQRSNSRRRGIQWDLTAWEWWQIWQRSGKWSQRGRGAFKYVMARDNDEGPYASWNVSIIRHGENVSRQKRNKSGLPVGVRAARGGGFEARRVVAGEMLHLGIHPTPELAHAAYLQAEARV